MLVYHSNKRGFLDVSDNGFIEDVIASNFLAKTGRYAPESEFRSWKASLAEVAKVLRDPDIPDTLGVGIEFGIPQTSKRIDVMLSGLGDDDRSRLIIVELKQWSSSTASNKDGVLLAQRGGSGLEREGLHPSYQAWSYAELLKGFNTVAYEDRVDLSPCAYLHNHPSGLGVSDPRYGEYLERAPVFLKGVTELQRLRDFIKSHIRKGDDADLIVQIEGGKIRPSKALADAVGGMVKGHREFILIDEQKLVFEDILAIERMATEERKQVVIVRGGPGTGKSVLAIQLMARITSERRLCKYVSKNAAPRAVYKARMKGSVRPSVVDNLFAGSGGFFETPRNTFDALIVDEGHRLNEKSGLYQNLGENQIGELIRSARCTVFFVDDDQIVTLSDIGHSTEIERWATREGAAVTRLELSSQFRCNGSDGYLAWLDDALGLRETANSGLSSRDYDFRVFDSPVELHEAIRVLNADSNRARLVAGYCWDWDSKKNPAAFDIVIPGHGFRRRWNLGSDGSLWIMAPNSVEEVGCIHTCQGLEVDAIGVIIGPDLVARDGQLMAVPVARSRQDKSIRGWKTMMRNDPEGTTSRLDRIIRNTYRTLMTRGMRSCFVYCTDEETREYFRQRQKAGVWEGLRPTPTSPSLDR
jgi:uncharacterized protein